MLRFLFIAGAIALCAGHAARADDEFSAARHYPGLTAKWRDVQARMSEDSAHLAVCRAEPQACLPEEKQLVAIADASREQEGRARVGHINRAVNLAIRPISDLARFGVADQWSAPTETLRAGGGDCEDYAILKFLILREAGLSESELKLLIVRQPGSRIPHAVLAARVEGDWILLDNRSFTLVRLNDSPYRVLTQFAAEPAAIVPANQALANQILVNQVLADAAGPDLPPLL
jgi:predicted transglutaminase-like cysteine proteinase